MSAFISTTMAGKAEVALTATGDEKAVLIPISALRVGSFRCRLAECGIDQKSDGDWSDGVMRTAEGGA